MTLEPQPPYQFRRILGRPLSAVLSRIRGLEQQVEFLRLLSEGVVSVGRGSQICPKVHVYRDPTGRIHGGRVRIGAFCSCGPHVEIFTGGNHRTDWVSTYQFRIQQGLPGAWKDGAPASKGDVTIGNDVWIGMGVTILSGVKIANGAVLGAHAVVSRDVRPYAVMVGNPAYEARRRFSDHQVESLERIAWWDWPWPQIRDQVPALCSDDIDGFLAKCEAEQ